jgi:hypothetical protein
MIVFGQFLLFFNVWKTWQMRGSEIVSDRSSAVQPAQT